MEGCNVEVDGDAGVGEGGVGQRGADFMTLIVVTTCTASDANVNYA